jgi:hypothetical protein
MPVSSSKRKKQSVRAVKVEPSRVRTLPQLLVDIRDFVRSQSSPRVRAQMEKAEERDWQKLRKQWPKLKVAFFHTHREVRHG